MTAADIARAVYERHLRRRPAWHPVWVFDDGGRAAAGHRGNAPGDCAVRALAIATGLPYDLACGVIREAAARERPGARKRSVRSHPRTGVWDPTFRRVMAGLGWVWHPTMGIGTGCRVHLRAEELPAGRLVVSLSRHYAAVIDGVVHDLGDPTRGGTRCVYGYWTPPPVR